jgi:hypothetical protein
MGNYANFEPDFINRTLALIEQYDDFIGDVDFKEQYNYTLLINCFLGLIVMPKERVIENIPEIELTQDTKEELGLANAEIKPSITNLKYFIHQLRNSIAHFNIEIKSKNDEFLVDTIIFRHINNSVVAKIPANEIIGFLKAYANVLLQNLH